MLSGLIQPYQMNESIKQLCGVWVDNFCYFYFKDKYPFVWGK